MATETPTDDLADDLADDLTDDAGDQTGPGRPRHGRSIFEVMRYVIPTLIVVGIFVALTVHAKEPLGNTDTYFHLRFGHEFLTGTWSLQHPGSVTSFGTADWVPTQWLPQVVMAQLDEWFGLAGVAWLAGLLYLTLAVTLWTVARHYSSPLVAAPVTVLAILAASPGMSMRPQVLSYVFIVLITAAWLDTRRDGKVRWWLVPMAWVWAMVHGMWPVGIVIGVVALLGLALDRAVPRRQWLRLASIPVLSLVVSALTPVGPRLFGAVLEVNSRGQYFAEWQPPDFTKANTVCLLVLLAVVVVRLARKVSAYTWTELLLLLLAGGWALYTNRTVMVAAVMLVPFAAAALQEALRERPAVSRLERSSVLLSAATCVVVLALVVPRTADEPPDDYPEWLTTLDEMPAGTVVLNDWGQGGYLMWRFPELDFVMNGYGDIYTDAEIARNYEMDATLPGWLDEVERTGATYALLRPGTRLTYSLDELQGWQVVSRSEKLVLLEAPDGWAD
jgi:hypothetical protein